LVGLAGVAQAGDAPLLVGWVEGGEVDQLHRHRARRAAQDRRQLGDAWALLVQLAEGQLAVQVEGDDQFVARPVAVSHGAVLDQKSVATRAANGS
jgi:hypothetical protein